MPTNQGFQNFNDILSQKKTAKAPAYQWQDLALKVITDLGIPAAKRNSVFSVCKKYDKIFIEKCLNETKELCQTGEPWRYFFKVVASLGNKKNDPAAATK
ncbi:MAG: hypothetical protein PHW95_04625 [Patescibacteria group bacterium]|nr:hypothetical protein [Patescibacteria group bacterium]